MLLNIYIDDIFFAFKEINISNFAVKNHINDKINKILEKDLRILYNDTGTLFEDMPIEDKAFAIHHQNISSLAIKIYEAINNLPGQILSKFLVRKNQNYKLCPESKLLVPNVNVAFEGKKWK